jgi:Bacterial alpha-L-rhamnosidase 6 hairpin glycosidase domain
MRYSHMYVTRDERSGWSGNAKCTSQAAKYYADMLPEYKQWFVDMRETQHSDGYIDNLAPIQGERAGAIEEYIPWSSAVVNVTHFRPGVVGNLTYI